MTWLLQTHFLPESDKVSQTFENYQASIDVSMGGRAAEEEGMLAHGGYGGS